MRLRAFLFVAFVGLSLLSGCSTPGGACNDEQDPAPTFKFRNVPRLLTEVGWFYASVQDMLFGVNYYCHIEHEFPSHVYD
jgi:hypothetical protein